MVGPAEKEEPVDLLVETDSRIFEMVQKELSSGILAPDGSFDAGGRARKRRMIPRCLLRYAVQASLNANSGSPPRGCRYVQTRRSR